MFAHTHIVAVLVKALDACAAMMFAFWFMAFAALLRGPSAVQARPVVETKRQYVYEARSVEASLTNGERVATFMQSTYGPERTAEMLAKVVRRARGAQPRSDGSQPRSNAGVVVIDIDEDSEGDDGKQIFPHGFWVRFIKEDLHKQVTKQKKCSIVVHWRCMLCASLAVRAPGRLCEAHGIQVLVAATAEGTTAGRQWVWVLHWCSGSLTIVSASCADPIHVCC